MAYISILGEHFLKIYQKRKFDGLHKHFWEVFSEKLPNKGNLMACVSRSHDSPKSENGEQVRVLI